MNEIQGKFMLQFIFGKPASGKTFTILNKIKESTEKNKQCVLIVPEQFTFESERAVLRSLGDKTALSVSVLSFSRIYDEVCRKVGGNAGKILSESDKVIFMKRALMQISGELLLWRKYTNSISFAKTMLDTIGEFKINAINYNDIKNASENSDNTILKNKLHDIALIYETFDTLIGEKFIDPADTLTKLYRQLENYSFFENKTVFFDSFKGFTGQQKKIIERIVSQADDVFFSFTNNPENTRKFNVYENIRDTVMYIKKIAKRYGVYIENDINLKDGYYNSKNINSVEALLSGEEVTLTEHNGAVTICSAGNYFDEAEFTARNIRRLVRTEGYRYRDFVVIARDCDVYKNAFAAACKKNGISLFFDERVPLSAFPLFNAAEAAISALKFSTQNILKFHKTGLGTLNYDEISTLENYVYLWNIDGVSWCNEWVADTRGFTADSDKKGENEKQLKILNELRVRALMPILHFKENIGNNAASMVKSLISLFEECNSTEKLIVISENYKNDNNLFTADVLKSSYDEFMKILDSIVLCFGNNNISVSEFSDALSMAVSLADVGVIPQMLDQISFGSADRIRPQRPKIAFILGANQGVFPRTVGNSGIFTVAERKELISNNIEIADNSITSSIDEEYLVYCNLCCPTDKLFILYNNQTLTGEKTICSAFVKEIEEKLDVISLSEPNDSVLLSQLPESENAVFSEYCREISNKNSSILNTYKEACADSVEISNKISTIDNFVNNNAKTILPDTAKKLYGKNINMSATKFDAFNRCSFSFFCRYGLGVKKIQPAEFDVMQRGTIVHFVLEQLINEHRDDISQLNGQELDVLTDKYIAVYLDSIKGYRKLENEKMKFLVSCLTRSLKDVVRHIASEIAQSEFKPVACELKIGNDGDIPAQLFEFDSGNIILSGSIDRIDSYNGFIRIIDYKTSSKSFKLPDILFGLNLQMLLYLYAIIRGQGKSDKLAAGILYQPSKRDTNDSGMAMNGLLPADLELLAAMDRNLSGEYIPKISINKDGSIAKKLTSFIEPEDFTPIFDFIENIMRKTGNRIASGDISVNPIDGRESPACKYCDFAHICAIEDREIERVPEYTNSKVIKVLKEGGEDVV